MRLIGPINALLIAAGTIALSCNDAWARAGGGGGYGGGGGGFGGGGGGFGGGGGGFSGGGSSGGGSGEGSALGLALVIAFFVIIMIASRFAKEHHVTTTIRRGRQKQADRLLAAGLQAITTHDPDFDLAQLQRRVVTAFEKIQAAWSAQNLASVRAFISDGIHERFSLQIGMQQAEGFRNVMENVRVHDCEAVAIYSNEQFDRIHLRIHASADDHNASLESGRRVPGTDHSGEFTEFWSFHRRPGAKSLASGGAIEGNCPRCGAGLEIVDVARCGSCGAQVNSGEFDWVLAEITQEQEWQVPGAEIELMGVAELRERDPGFNIQHIEDRVSVMFYRLRAAEFHRNEEYVTPVIVPSYREQIQQTLQDERYYHDPVIGMVELLDATEDPKAEREILRVKVRWSGTLKERTGNAARTLRDQAIYTQVFILGRKRSVQTNLKETFTSAGCSNCGAPISVNREGACVYCGTVLTTGAHDWVLEDVRRYTAEIAADRPVPVPDEENAAETLYNRPTDAQLPLAVLAKVALVDGHIDDRERQALNKLAGHRGLTEDRAEQLIQQAKSSDGWLPVPTNHREGRAYLEQLVHVVLADGQINRNEKRLLTNFAVQLGYSAADVRMAVQRERKRAYRQARAELRGKA